MARRTWWKADNTWKIVLPDNTKFLKAILFISLLLWLFTRLGLTFNEEAFIAIISLIFFSILTLSLKKTTKLLIFYQIDLIYIILKYSIKVTRRLYRRTYLYIHGSQLLLRTARRSTWMVRDIAKEFADDNTIISIDSLILNCIYRWFIFNHKHKLVDQAKLEAMARFKIPEDRSLGRAWYIEVMWELKRKSVEKTEQDLFVNELLAQEYVRDEYVWDYNISSLDEDEEQDYAIFPLLPEEESVPEESDSTVDSLEESDSTVGSLQVLEDTSDYEISYNNQHPYLYEIY